MDIKTCGNDIDIAKLGQKKTRISIGLTTKGIKKTGKGSKGNVFFHREDYILPLLKLLEEEKCYTNFSLIDKMAVYEFCDSETGAKIVSSIPWAKVNIIFTDKKTGEIKKVLDDMQEIGAGGSYALRYLEVWFFNLSLSEEHIIDSHKEYSSKTTDGYIYNKDGHKLLNPLCICTEAQKIPMMYSAAKSKLPGFKFDTDNLIKICLKKLVDGKFIESDSKSAFPLYAMGALLKIINETREIYEKKFLERTNTNVRKGNTTE